MDTLYPSFYPSLSFMPPPQTSLISQQQQLWDNSMSEPTRLRVAFVLQTLLCLLRLYGNKQANSISISVLRSIFDVMNECENKEQNASEEEMKYAFYYVWNKYQLIGSAGKAISTYYLSDVMMMRKTEI